MIQKDVRQPTMPELYDTVISVRMINKLNKLRCNHIMDLIVRDAIIEYINDEK